MGKKEHFYCSSVHSFIFSPDFPLMRCCLSYDQQEMAKIWVQIAELRCWSTCVEMTNQSTIHLPKQPIGPRNTLALGPFSPCMREQPWQFLWP